MFVTKGNGHSIGFCKNIRLRGNGDFQTMNLFITFFATTHIVCENKDDDTGAKINDVYVHASPFSFGDRMTEGQG